MANSSYGCGQQLDCLSKSVVVVRQCLRCMNIGCGCIATTSKQTSKYEVALLCTWRYCLCTSRVTFFFWTDGAGGKGAVDGTATAAFFCFSRPSRPCCSWVELGAPLCSGIRAGPPPPPPAPLFFFFFFFLLSTWGCVAAAPSGCACCCWRCSWLTNNCSSNNWPCF